MRSIISWLSQNVGAGCTFYNWKGHTSKWAICDKEVHRSHLALDWVLPYDGERHIILVCGEFETPGPDITTKYLKRDNELVFLYRELTPDTIDILFAALQATCMQIINIESMEVKMIDRKNIISQTMIDNLYITLTPQPFTFTSIKLTDTDTLFIHHEATDKSLRCCGRYFIICNKDIEGSRPMCNCMPFIAEETYFYFSTNWPYEELPHLFKCSRPTILSGIVVDLFTGDLYDYSRGALYKRISLPPRLGTNTSVNATLDALYLSVAPPQYTAT